MKLFVLFIVSVLLAEEATARNELPRCGPELESGFIGADIGVGAQRETTQTIKGAVVWEVLAGGPAEQAGMRKGDVIVSFAGAPVSDFISLVALTGATQPGSLATVQVLRKSFFSAERTETLRVEVKGRTGLTYARGWSRCWGSRTRIDGALEEGEYLNGFLHGQGEITFANGNRYVGEFKDGQPNGQGNYTAANGDLYVGEYKDGVRNGRGIYTYANGRPPQEGIWANDKFVRAERIPDHIAGRSPASPPPVAPAVSPATLEPTAPGFYRFKRGDTLISIALEHGVDWRELAAANDISNPNVIEMGRLLIIPLSRSTAPAPSVATMPTAPHQAESPRSTLSLTVSSSSPDANGVVTFAITTNSDTASLKINGDEEGGRSDGRYSVRRFAQVGKNQFEVVATDRFGNTQRQTVSVNREFAQTAPTVPALNPLAVRVAKPRDAVAIVIGIEKYRSVPSADFANRDASIFVDYARRALGIPTENIRLLLDEKADSIEMLRTFRNWLPTRVNRGKTDVYVFFSGHGLPAADGRGLYFLPHEVDKDLLDRTAVTQKEVVEAIERTTPKSVTMFIDSCYSGQSRTGETLLASARPISIAAKETSNFPANFTVISASAPDQISSSSPELRHGIFSYYLMRGMEGEADANKDGQITVAEMQAYLAERVLRRAMGMNRTQQPQVVGDQTRVLVER